MIVVLLGLRVTLERQWTHWIGICLFICFQLVHPWISPRFRDQSKMGNSLIPWGVLPFFMKQGSKREGIESTQSSRKSRNRRQKGIKYRQKAKSLVVQRSKQRILISVWKQLLLDAGDSWTSPSKSLAVAAFIARERASNKESSIPSRAL